MRTTLLTAPMASRVGLDLVDQPGHDRLVRRGHAEPEPRVARPGLAHGAFDRIRLQLEQDVAGVDAGRVERGVMHDLRVPPLERLAEQPDASGHRCQGVGGRRTGPAVGGNVTFGMMWSTHSWSWAGSGVIVCRKKYSTPASTRAWSEAMTSFGVPNR